MMHLRKTTEITGYADTENGVVYCLDCRKEWKEQQACGLQPHNDELTPIFLGDEWDAPGPVCDICFELIETNIIYYMGENQNGRKSKK